MIIGIMGVCHKCSKSVNRNFTVDGWSKVKAVLKVDTNFVCPRCGGKAAFFYWYRNIGAEPGITIQEKKDWRRHDHQQLLGQTTDADEPKYKDPVAITVSMKRPDTREELTIG